MAEPGLYDQRFSADEKIAKEGVWRILCRDFFQRYVGRNDAVLDLGAGFCEFINHIDCREKYAQDVDPRVRDHAGPDVRVHCGPAADLGWLADESLDVVFTSNFFEHMETKADVLTTLRECRRVLRNGGTILVLQPNIRYAYRVYWDFFDHHLPFSHESMAEALELAGFEVVESRARFLPYSTKSALPQWPILVAVYLRLAILHRLIGQQMFLVGRRKDAATDGRSH